VGREGRCRVRRGREGKGGERRGGRGAGRMEGEDRPPMLETR